MPRAPRTISRALFDFAAPLLDALPPNSGADAARPMFALATLIWNAVVLEQLGSPKPYLEEVRERITREFEGVERATLLEVVAQLVATKRRESPPDLRVITEFEVEEDGPGQLSLRAEATVRRPSTPLRQRSSERGPEPRPEPDDFSWIALYEAAGKLRSFAPWRWMGDAERFGVQDPTTGEIDWCVVLGQAGEFEGLAVYLGTKGLEQLERMLASSGEDQSPAFGQDALVLSFVDRDEVKPEERARMKRLGFSFRGRGAWPLFESHGLNRIAIVPNVAEARRMVDVIEQVLDVARRAALDPELVQSDASGERLVRITSGRNDGRKWSDARRAVTPPKEIEIPSFDQLRASRLAQSLPRGAIQIQCDLFPAPAVIGAPGEAAYCPALFLVVEAERGTIVSANMHEPRGREAWVQEELLRVIELLGVRPEAVFVARKALDRLLAPLAASLGIRLEHAEELDRLEEARESLMDWMSGV